ncbi:SnoaL-like protein [Dongia mobilis]|uniref:SnoaL-like protein n=1 Tax=Dongia mobilis TaxID=578943 RepID=A0A4R6WGY1_9PROT|nr:nuclear transport factor 2 family protein [Dongia mobilis]TDQ77561.1 SnoaL-like protein [Dongia mobilis]
MAIDAAATLQDYLALWADPSPDRDLDRLDGLTTESIVFRDPIQEVHGRDGLKALFADSHHSVADSDVRIDGIAWVDQRRAFVKWHYAGTIRRLSLPNWSVTGMSDIRFDERGLIVKHEDHWDLASGLFEHFPLIGGLFRRLRMRLRLKR